MCHRSRTVSRLQVVTLNHSFHRTHLFRSFRWTLELTLTTKTRLFALNVLCGLLHSLESPKVTLEIEFFCQNLTKHTVELFFVSLFNSNICCIDKHLNLLSQAIQRLSNSPCNDNAVKNHFNFLSPSEAFDNFVPTPSMLQSIYLILDNLL